MPNKSDEKAAERPAAPGRPDGVLRSCLLMALIFIWGFLALTGLIAAYFYMFPPRIR